MKYCIILLNILFVVAAGCKQDHYQIPAASFDDGPPGPPSVVKTVRVNDKWRLLVNDTDFYIKGVAANDYWQDAIRYGANAVRTYGVSKSTKSIMDSVYKVGLFVNFGIYIKREVDGFDYNDEAAVKAQFESTKAAVNRFKDHPALLVWSIGNEAEASYTNRRLWTAINDIAKMIHEIDKNHPTTVTLATSNVDHIRNIMQLAPEIDILSVNCYAPNLPGVPANLQAAGWNKPYMITEFGPRGTWQMAPEPQRILPWGGLVEQTSTEKAADYLHAYQQEILPNRDKGCLGSFVFLWGYQRHGEVLTWYGLFDKKKNSFEAADAMQYAWTGQYPANRAPVIASRNDLLLNGKKAEAAVTLPVNGQNNTAMVTAADPEGDPLTYEWLIVKEKAAASDGSLPEGMEGLIADNKKAQISFKAPAEGGAYRLYVFVRDDTHKKVASAVIPFLVN
ncbi:glycoside hydrolase family 2 TIM barrel-domain containing protein [Niabella beijingensis]|uniref:glycoside hydrolase family 2 TIM barrel-domain containing protein n=1 Tax=Niabella beijingensis TaxID=2872700 RepID=UPI001CBD56EC|nr:glycoside hydrolase family 2 TIM barrel-domain containing protein [Niabella beijingensis]MBZ4190173.1 hypothetical protein [Niabella beijingensis]